MVRTAFRGGAAHVRVPATSANLGPGFDCLGLALSPHDDLVARIGEDGAEVDVAGEGADDVARDESNLVIKAMRSAFDELGGQPRGIELSCANRIPHGRGLGSSAAAIVAGVLLARALVLQGEELLPDPAVLALASAIEGHPDNVAACLLGGFTIAWTQDTGGVQAVRLDVDQTVIPVMFVPPTPSSTEQARKVLPREVPHADAAYNLARSALLVAALSGRPDALFEATSDRLHQPYRANDTPASAELVTTLRSAGIAAVISGAGPSVLALTTGSDEARRAEALRPAGWTGGISPVDAVGAHFVR